ncbi:hypothetical protein LSAT2_016268 [Lamellibrachia satsuma]|nr:hypothetical protein LSAT2_016268 [Lamellibrachia satsuma]
MHGLLYTAADSLFCSLVNRLVVSCILRDDGRENGFSITGSAMAPASSPRQQVTLTVQPDVATAYIVLG